MRRVRNENAYHSQMKSQPLLWLGKFRGPPRETARPCQDGRRHVTESPPRGGGTGQPRGPESMGMDGSYRLGVVAIAALAACAGPQPAPEPAPPPAKVAMPIVPPPPPPELVSRYRCDGAVLHPLRQGAIETPLAFWFGTDRKDRVYGQVVPVARPLALSGGDLRGLFDMRRDQDGALIGGELRLRWPEGADGQSVRLSVMKETFVRVGPRKNGVGKVKMRAGDHLYLAGRIDLGPGLRSAVLNATCASEAP